MADRSSGDTIVAIDRGWEGSEFNPVVPPWLGPRDAPFNSNLYPTYKYSFPDLVTDADSKIATIDWAVKYEANNGDYINNISNELYYPLLFYENGDYSKSDLYYSSNNKVSKNKAVNKDVLDSNLFIYRDSNDAAAKIETPIHLPKINPFCKKRREYLNDSGIEFPKAGKCILQTDLLASAVIPVRIKPIVLNNNGNNAVGKLTSGRITIGGTVVYDVNESNIETSWLIAKSGEAFPIGYTNIEFENLHLPDNSVFYMAFPKLTVKAYDINQKEITRFNVSIPTRVVGETDKDPVTKETLTANDGYQPPYEVGCIYPMWISSTTNENGYNAHHSGYGYYKIPTRSLLKAMNNLTLSDISYIELTLTLYAYKKDYCPDSLRLFKLDVQFTYQVGTNYTIDSKCKFNNNYTLYKIYNGRDGCIYNDGRLEWWFIGSSTNPLPTEFSGVLIKYTKDNTPFYYEKCFTIDLRPKPIKNVAGDLIYGSIEEGQGDFIETLASHAFSNCYLEDVILPTKLKEIPNYAFAYSAINGIVWLCPEGSLSSFALNINTTFYWSGNIPKLALRTIGDYAFYEANFVSLPILRLPTVIQLKKSCFAGSTIYRICVNLKATLLEEYAFASCSDLRWFGHTGITNSFADSGLYNIHIPDNITKIGDNCFYHSMTHDWAWYGWRERYTYANTNEYYVAVHFGSNVKKIGACAFYFSEDDHGCPIDFGTKAHGKTLYSLVAEAANAGQCLLHRVIYNGTLDQYKKIDFGKQWMDLFWLFSCQTLLVNGILNINKLSDKTGISATFDSYTLAKDIALESWYPETTPLFVKETCVYDIPPNAFCGCWTIRELYFTGENLVIGENAFRDCYAITKMEAKGSGSLHRVCDGAFALCRQVNLDSGFFVSNFGVKYIGEDSLYYYGGSNTGITENNFNIDLTSVVMTTGGAVVTFLAAGKKRDATNASVTFADLRYVVGPIVSCTISSEYPRYENCNVYIRSIPAVKSIVDGEEYWPHGFWVYTVRTVPGTSPPGYHSMRILDSGVSLAPFRAYIHVEEGRVTASMLHLFKYLIDWGSKTYAKWYLKTD